MFITQFHHHYCTTLSLIYVKLTFLRVLIRGEFYITHQLMLRMHKLNELCMDFGCGTAAAMHQKPFKHFCVTVWKIGGGVYSTRDRAKATNFAALIISRMEGAVAF